MITTNGALRDLEKVFCVFLPLFVIACSTACKSPPSHSGDIGRASYYLGRAQDAAILAGDRYSLEEIGKTWIHLGQLMRAREVAENYYLFFRSSENVVARDYVRYQVTLGQSDDALAFAAEMPDCYDSLVAVIVSAQAKSGDIERAKQTIGLIKTPGCISQAWQDIIATLAKKGDISGAQKLLGHLEPNDGIEAYIAIAVAQTKTKDQNAADTSFRRAKQMIESLKGRDEDRDDWSQNLITAYLETGNLDGALDVQKLGDDELFHLNVYRYTAYNCEGNLDYLRRIRRQLDQISNSASARDTEIEIDGIIAAELAKAGDEEASRRMLDSLPVRYRKASVKVLVHNAILRSDAAGAIDAAAMVGEDPMQSIELLGEITTSFRRVGDAATAAKALRLAEAHEPPPNSIASDETDQILSGLTVAYARLGDWAQSKAIFDRIGDARSRAKCIQEVAKLRARGTSPQDLDHWLDSLSPDRCKALGYLGAAQGFSNCNDCTNVASGTAAHVLENGIKR